MTSIPVAICRYSGNNLKRFYLNKEKYFTNFWLHFWNVHEIYNILKKRTISYPNYYRNNWIRNRSLLKRLKDLSSAHHSAINVLTGSKHCWSQHGTTIFLRFHEFKINWVRKSLPSSHLKSSYSFLTGWLPMTSIPVAICRYSGDNFKRFYLKRKTHFVNFWLHFWNVHEI